MTDIPKRVFDIWLTPLNIETIGGIMNLHKLQCSKCEAIFEDEVTFAIHIDECLKGIDHDLNYLVHMHANRLLMTQNHIANYCGSTAPGNNLECELCKEVFRDVKSIRMHIRHCKHITMHLEVFSYNTNALFNNLLHSYEKLGLLFQQYVLDEHIIKIKAAGRQKPAKGELPNLEPGNIDFDDLKEHFIEKYQFYTFAVDDLFADAFFRYLRKRNIDADADKITYSMPAKKRRILEDDDEENEYQESSEEDQYEDEGESIDTDVEEDASGSVIIDTSTEQSEEGFSELEEDYEDMEDIDVDESAWSWIEHESMEEAEDFRKATRNAFFYRSIEDIDHVVDVVNDEPIEENNWYVNDLQA